MHPVLAAVTAVVAAASPPSPLLASNRIGAITGDCSSDRHATLTFWPDRWAPSETVRVRAGSRRAHRETYGGGGPLVRITVPLVRQRPRPGGFADLTPIVTWRVFQTHEPDETRAVARLQVEDVDGECQAVLARLRLRTRSHEG